jgi:two-component system, LytTR family, sensor kinase
MDLSGVKRIARAYFASIVVWSALSLLTGWNYLIFDQSTNLRSTVLKMMLMAESRGLAFALLTPPMFYIVRRYSSRRPNALLYVGGYCLGVGPFMFIYACVRAVILPPWDSALERFVARNMSTPLDLLHYGFANIIYNYLVIVLAAHAYNYFERIRKQELERSEYQQALAASELEALRMQLHPHFLFNTLHGISTLIESDGKTAKEMILKLSNLLRIALDRSGSDLIPLREELKWVGEYLDLEKMRFGARLTVTWSIDVDTENQLVPQLILQPLVENAIRYGIASSREKSWVEITAQRRGELLELTVRNNVGARRNEGTGLGLRNTEARLRHLYANEAVFSFALTNDRTATSKLVLPTLRCAAQARAELMAPDSGEREAELHAGTHH